MKAAVPTVGTVSGKLSKAYEAAAPTVGTVNAAVPAVGTLESLPTLLFQPFGKPVKPRSKRWNGVWRLWKAFKRL